MILKKNLQGKKVRRLYINPRHCALVVPEDLGPPRLNILGPVEGQLLIVKI
jgi:hypothetical protein